MTENKHNLVSVIIPVFNGATYVLRAIESVRHQTHRDCEIIVVDDGSTDGTKNLLKPLAESGEIIYVYQENKGLAGARNTGLKYATGEYLKFLDCDDVLYPEQLKLQVDHLDAKPENVLSVTGYEIEFPSKRKKKIEPWLGGDSQLARFIEGNPCPVHIVLVRRSLVDKMGGFCEELKCSEDSDLWMRILIGGGRLEQIPYIGCCYNMVEGSLSDSEDRMLPARVLCAERMNTKLQPMIDSLDRKILNSLLMTNFKVMHTCYLRNYSVTKHMPVALAVSRRIYEIKSGWARRLFINIVGIRTIMLLNYLKRRLTNPKYKYMLLNTHIHWRKEESYN